jgi:hydroxyacyl-ACP dehydratase HTD2-like protein with hotdog domain
MSELTLADLGLKSVQHSVLAAEQARMLAATLDVSLDPTSGLPTLWHWAFFNPVVETNKLGPDGHPRRDSSLLGRFARRMWVGGEVYVERRLKTDTVSVRRSRLLNYGPKRGSTGELFLVSLEHIVEQEARIAIIERQDVIFRTEGGITQPTGPAVTPPPATEGWREIVRPSAALLFRFSAVTFNSHRIHYDHEYATRIEGYPGLVVQGPLTAMVLAESASRHLGKSLRSFVYRALSPSFVDEPLCVDGVAEEDSYGDVATMAAIRSDGATAMTATAIATTSA